MKKISTFFLCAAVAAAASCSKPESNQSLSTEVQFPEEESVLTPIRFSTNSNPVGISTKAYGPVNEWNPELQLYIYGYAVDKTDHSIIDIATPYINNVMAYAPAVSDENHKGQIEVFSNAEERIPFYYQQKTVYNFYGYYTDGAATAEPSTETGVLSVPVTIDGGQDIMLAKTDNDADLEAAKLSAVDDPDLTAQLTNIENNYKSLIYSEYTARRGVSPTLNFEHCLARFDFEIVAGNQSVIDNNVNVTAIQFVEANNTGVLTIAPEQSLVPDAEAELATLSLQEKGEEGILVPLTPKALTLEAAPVGSSLMLFPADQYSLQFTMTQNNVIGEQVSSPQVLTPEMFVLEDGERPATFAAGYRYVVTIKVYGLEEITISVKLKEWVDGGNYELDPDNPDQF